MIGVAMAPKATGAVLETSTTTAARIGVKPMDISMTPVIATGAPNPASASNRPPKQNAMITACTRGSSEIRSITRRRSSKRPLATVSSYNQMAFRTIHMIGKSPNANPSVADSAARLTGIPYATTATISATANPVSPAQCAFHLRTPRVTKTVSSGRIATRDDHSRLCAIGARSGVYIGVRLLW